MSEDIERARAALAETDRIFEQITKRGRTPPMWFVDYRIRLRLLIAGAITEPVEKPAQLQDMPPNASVH